MPKAFEKKKYISWEVRSEHFLYAKGYSINWTRRQKPRRERDWKPVIQVHIMFWNMISLHIFQNYSISSTNDNYIFSKWCFDFNFWVTSFIFHWKLHIKYLRSCEGKEYVRRKLKCISTLIRPRSCLRLLLRVVLNFILKILTIFNFHIVIRWENAGRKWCQRLIQLQRQQKESPRLQNYRNLPPPFWSSSIHTSM